MKLSDSHKISQEKWDFKISDVLITAWSRVQVLAGPPKKHEILLSCFSFCMNRRFTCTILCSSVSESHHVVCRRPACRLQGSCWAERVRLLRPPLPHRYWDWTAGCSRRCARTYADGFSRLGVHITEHMIRWPFLFAPHCGRSCFLPQIASDPAVCSMSISRRPVILGEKWN